MSGFISAIVLAAGTSSRMGRQNKLLTPFPGKPLISYVVENLIAAQVSEIIVVLGFEASRVSNALAGKKVRFVENQRYRQGMTTSIQAGVRAAGANSDGYMICQADMPLITTAEYDVLLSHFDQLLQTDPEAMQRPAFDGQYGNPVIFSSAFREEILAHDDPEGCRGILRDHREHVYEIAMENDHILRDIDTPEALDDLKSRIVD